MKVVSLFASTGIALLAFYFDKRVVVANKTSDSVHIKLDSGILHGSIKKLEDGQSYYSFQGIPFAVPPLGDLRFKDPVPYKKWKGVLNATKFGPNCVELLQRQISFSVAGQEDCLYINVYTPQNPHVVDKPLPVMFWIYGGSFREGSASLYGPENFMKQGNVIIVTANYRLGVFGFLSTQDSNAPGNYGLKDVLLSLKWVKTNIAKFGGNPEKVTILGESAGASIVGYLLLSKQSKGLFSAAIMQSGSPLCFWAVHQNPKKVAFDLGVSLGISTNNTYDLVRYLRNADLANAHRAMINVNFLNLIESMNNGGPFGPVIEPDTDNAFVTKDSYKAFKKGDFNKVPVMIGVTSEESKFFASTLDLFRPVLFLDDLSPSSLVRTSVNIKSVKDRRLFARKVKSHYIKSGSFVDAMDSELIDYFSDDLFVRPVTKTAQLLSRYVPVYFYVYDYEGNVGKAWLEYMSKNIDKVKGVAHSTEVWYLWKSPFPKVQLKTDEEKLTSKRLTTLWANFASYGHPTPRKDRLFQNVQWPAVKGSDIDYFYIGKNVKLGKNFKGKNIRFWTELYANYSKGPIETY